LWAASVENIRAVGRTAKWRNIMASAKRNENETFKAYRARLTKQAEADKDRRKGRVIWASSQRGTYEREVDGAIGG